MGAIFCSNNECPFYKKEVRPPTDEKRIKQCKCMEYQSPMKWNMCEVQVVFYFSYKNMNCTMTQTIDESKDIMHNHGAYLAKHLSQDEKVKFDEIAKKSPLITPAAATAGTDGRIYDFVLSIS
jgi:hypothetical protein